MKTAETKASRPAQANHSKSFFNRNGQVAFFSAEQESVQTKSFFSKSPAHAFLQTKLSIGRSGDQYEQEANAMADQVMRMPAANTSAKEEEQEETVQTKLQVQRQTEEEQIHRQTQEEEEIQANLFQRQSEEEEEIQPKPIVQSQPEEEEEMLQAKGAPPAGVSSSFEWQLTSNKGSGERLDSHTQQFMESGFNADFSGVRVHTDQQAVQMSQQINAHAFAHGSDIYFNQGKYNPGTGEGRQLLAHELTHTIQQGASVQRKPVAVHTHNRVNVQAGFDLPDIDLPDIDLPDIDISIDAFRDKLGDYADDYLPAYSLLSVVISYDLIRSQSVARNQDNIIKGIFSLINPFGSLLRQRLEERGIIDDAFNWINTQLSELGLTRANVEKKFDEFWAEKEIVRTDFLSYNLGLLERKFGPFLTSIGQFINRATDQVFTMIKNAFLQLLADLARQLGGYDLLADLLGQDPITGEERNATTADILRGVLRLPDIQAIGGDKLLIKLESENLIEKAAAWMDAQWALLQASFTNVYNIATRFIEGFSFETLKDPMGFINGLKEDVVGFVTNITQFFRNLASKVLELIKEALIALLKTFINENTYGFDLVKVVLGRDPLTGEPYPRTAENIITAFLKLLPNGEALAAHMKETGAIQQAMDWVMGAIQEFIQVITAIKMAFINLWSSASIDNLFEPIPFFTQILNLFAEPVQRLVAFVRRVLFKLLEILFQIMKLPIDLAQQIIANIQRAYQDIRQDPIAFLLNLLGAVKLGFQQFFGNFLPHLMRGLQTWLFGQLAEAGIQPPPDLSFRSILGLVFDIFGITVNNILDRLAQKIGHERVARMRAFMDKLTGIWSFVKDVIARGPIAIWERIQAQLNNLWDIVVEGVKNWIMTNIIEKVTAKLLSMLDPTGVMAVINGFIAFYRAVQSFIEQLHAMLEIANSFVAGVVDIARGSLQTAANFLENALSQALPVAINFLATQVGLRGLGKRIAEIIEGVRERVNQGIDWLVDRAMSAGSAVLRTLGVGGKREEVDEAGEEAEMEALDIENWWEVREEFNDEEGEGHSLYFSGSGPDARLMVASTPTTHTAFIEQIQTQEPEQERAKTNAREIAERLDAEVRAFAPRNLPSEDRRSFYEQKRRNISVLLDELSQPLGILLAGQDLPAGTYDDPIPIRWTKRGMVLVISDLIPKDENWRRYGMTPPEPIEQAPANGKTKLEIPPTMWQSRFSEEQTGQKNGREIRYIEIGVGNQNIVKINDKIQRSTGGRSDREKNRFRNTLLVNNYHYNMGPYDMDHILDLGFGGQDTISNLWPLYREMNQNFGTQIYEQVVSYADENGNLRLGTPKTLPSKWFQIDSIGDL